ncbi:MAG TPA: hypothetical protein VD736_08115 [Nitrososphaera sp.]|nr:hypothetical protein [Nitrososphaera sp.]
MRKPYQVREAMASTSKAIPISTHCGQPATKEALFRDGGAIIVEKYCDDCLKSEKFTAIMMFYSRFE